jgi:hypothetical protein
MRLKRISRSRLSALPVILELKRGRLQSLKKIYRGHSKWWSPFWATNLSRHFAKQRTLQSKKNIATIFFLVCDRAFEEGTPPRCGTRSVCNGPERHKGSFAGSETYPGIYRHPVRDGVRISTVGTFVGNAGQISYCEAAETPFIMLRYTGEATLSLPHAKGPRFR